MAEQGVATLFERIEHLKSGGKTEDQLSELFRMWAMMEWMLKLEGRPVLEEMDNQQLALKIRNGLIQAKEELKQMKVTRIKVPADTKGNGDEEAEFPKYLELPGPVVRRNILSFLETNDLLNVARALRSEAQYFKPSLSWHQMKAVFPILMDRKLLETSDLQNLSAADPFCSKFVIQRLENIEWKGTFADISELNPITLEELPQGQEGHPIVSPVIIKLSLNMDPSLVILRSCGVRVLYAILKIEDNETRTPEMLLNHLAACLHLMPRLKVLYVGPARDHFDFKIGINPEVLPELPFLKNLSVVGNDSIEVLLLVKYGLQLDRLYMCTDGRPAPGFPVLTEGAQLTNLTLSQLLNPFLFFEVPLSQATIFRNFWSFAYCPITTLNLFILNGRLDQLLTLVGNHWGGTLESLEIHITRFRVNVGPYLVLPEDNPPPVNPTWMLNLRFPKLKRLMMAGNLLDIEWVFLLLFPQLEELGYYGRLRPNDGYLQEEDDNRQEYNVAVENPLLITVHSDRNRMLGSSIWKLLPALEKITLDYEKQEVVTRRDSIAAAATGQDKNEKSEPEEMEN